MVKRPVEFDTARRPGPRDTYHARFNYFVSVNKVVVVGFVERAVNFAADSRKSYDFNVFILQNADVVNDVFLFVAYLIGIRDRIHFAASALISPFFEK